MKFYVSILIMLLSIAAQAQHAAPFSEESAKALAAEQGNFKEIASGLLQKAQQQYQAKDLAAAAANLDASRLIEAMGEAAVPVDANLVAFMLSDQDFCDEFSKTLSPEDNLPEVFTILNNIYKADAQSFKKFPRLAAAIAVVFDTPPPATWPHHQVSEKDLPRKFADPVQTFKMWIEDREKGRLLCPCEKLSIEEAKFLVASVASREDRLWARRSVSANAAGIEKIYSSVPYDYGRVNSSKFDWQGGEYRLERIKEKGGICTDQSYFTSEVAKAKGLPSFILSGAGSDGFHAWTAYMLKGGKWNFSVGRYDGGNFVTGRTIDPQTWKTSTNHQLQRMSQGFRRNKKYRLNELHTEFARIYFQQSDTAKAKAAAAEAIRADPRNFETWSLLFEIAKKSESQDEADKVCNNALKAFGRYPDSDAYFRNILIEDYLGKDKRAEAKKLTTAFINKYKSSRPDLAMEFARRELLIDIDSGDLKKLKSSYKRLFNLFKKNPAMTLNGIVVPVLEKLVNEGKTDKALEVMEQTKDFIKSYKDKTIVSNFDSVFKQVQAFIDKPKSSK